METVRRKQPQRAGLTQVICTDLDCEARAAGPNLELAIEAVRRFPALEWQLAGGIRDAADLWALANGGATAAISTRALLAAARPATELAAFLADEQHREGAPSAPRRPGGA